MNLIKRFKLSRELARMEKRAKENPSPSTFVDLAQAYINLGWIDHTLRVAQEGLLLFPRSEELQKVHRYARMNRLNKRVTELRARISKHPNPEAYHELASVYREMGDQGALLNVCQECIRRFPEDGEAYLILGETEVQGYYRSLVAKQGRSAMKNLLHVLELDNKNESAHQQLARLFFRIGAVRQAKEHLEHLAGRRECDPEFHSLLDLANKMPENEDDADRLLRVVEERGSLLNRGDTSTRGNKSVASEEAISGIREGLSRLVQVEGVLKAAYIRGSKALVKGEIKNGRDPFLKAIRVIAKASQRAARRMDLGNFSKGIVDGSFGHICICTFGDVSAAIQVREGTQVDRLLNDLQDLVAGSLFMAGQR